ncbi:MAG: hypothetical protein VYE04_18755 [Pseudomonadota bacterium]|nr:hypothetical protein [Pseudomonadota bacterium]
MRSKPDNEEGGILTRLGVQARLRQISETTDISVMTGVELAKYSGVDYFKEDSRESFFLEGRANRQFQRYGLNLRTSFNRQDTLRYFRIIEPVTFVEALPEADSEDYLPEELAVEDDLITTVHTDAGSSQQLVQRNRFSVQPSFSYSIDPRTSVQLNYGFYDMSYSDVPPNSYLQDSQSHIVGFGIQRATSPRNHVSLKLSRSRFEPEFNLDSDSTNVQISWQRRLSERTSLTLSAGARKTETDIYDDTGGLFSGRLNHQLPSGSMFFLMERGLTGSGYGSEMESDRLSIGYSNKLSDRVSWKISARAFRATRISGVQRDSGREFVQISPSIQWAFSKNWQVRVSYRYTRIDREWIQGLSYSNSVSLSMEYVPSRRP